MHNKIITTNNLWFHSK